MVFIRQFLTLQLHSFTLKPHVIVPYG
jgi:hypothetical protein